MEEELKRQQEQAQAEMDAERQKKLEEEMRRQQEEMARKLKE